MAMRVLQPQKELRLLGRIHGPRLQHTRIGRSFVRQHPGQEGASMTPEAHRRRSPAIRRRPGRLLFVRFRARGPDKMEGETTSTLDSERSIVDGNGQSASAGEEETALAQLFSKHELKLSGMVRRLIGHRLAARIDAEDVLQAA